MNWLRTTILLAALTGLFLAIGIAIGGQSGLIIAIICALITNVGAYWFSDKLILSFYHAQPVTSHDAPKLYHIVQKLAQQANLPMPKIYIINDSTPNAFATGRDPQHAVVAATTGILKILNDEELAGVLAHELSHVKHRDTLISTIAATIAGAIGMLANMLQWSFGFRRDSEHDGGPSALASLFMIIMAPITATLIQLAVSRTREYAADEEGAKLCGNSHGLANALRKLENANRQNSVQGAVENPATAHLFIVNPLSGSSFVQLFATHPPIQERVKRLEALQILQP